MLNEWFFFFFFVFFDSNKTLLVEKNQCYFFKISTKYLNMMFFGWFWNDFRFLFSFEKKFRIVMAAILSILPFGIIIAIILIIIVNIIRLFFIQYRSYHCLKTIPGPDFHNPWIGNLKLFIDIICKPNYRPSQGEFFLFKYPHHNFFGSDFVCCFDDNV